LASEFEDDLGFSLLRQVFELQDTLPFIKKETIEILHVTNVRLSYRMF